VANQPRRRQTDAIDERQLRYGDNNYLNISEATLPLPQTFRGRADMAKPERYYDGHAKTDAGLRAINKTDFRNYYGLPASVSFSLAPTPSGTSSARSMRNEAQ
jgi:hypothetical protein